MADDCYLEFYEDEAGATGFYKVCSGEIVSGPFDSSSETTAKSPVEPESKGMPPIFGFGILILALVLMALSFRHRQKNREEQVQQWSSFPPEDLLKCPACHSTLGLKSEFPLAEHRCKCGTKVNTLTGLAI